jgi:hypothetical protein
VEETALQTLTDTGSSKLIEVRNDYAYLVDYQLVKKRRIDSGASDSGMTEEFPEIEHLKWPSIYLHGGVTVNGRTKKEKFMNDFYHVNT